MATLLSHEIVTTGAVNMTFKQGARLGFYLRWCMRMMMTGKNSSAGHGRAATKDFTFTWQQLCCTEELQLVPWHKAQQSLAAVSVVNPSEKCWLDG